MSSNPSSPSCCAAVWVSGLNHIVSLSCSVLWLIQAKPNISSERRPVRREDTNSSCWFEDDIVCMSENVVSSFCSIYNHSFVLISKVYDCIFIIFSNLQSVHDEHLEMLSTDTLQDEGLGGLLLDINLLFFFLWPLSHIFLFPAAQIVLQRYRSFTTAHSIMAGGEGAFTPIFMSGWCRPRGNKSLLIDQTWLTGVCQGPVGGVCGSVVKHPGSSSTVLFTLFFFRSLIHAQALTHSLEAVHDSLFCVLSCCHLIC